MSSSPHRIKFGEALREVRVCAGGEIYRSESTLRKEIEDRFRSGYETGQRAIGEELIRQRNQLLEIQNNILRSIERTLPAVVAQCERQVIELALQAARRVVQETAISAELVEATVKAGLAELQGATEYLVRLHPEDYALLQTIQTPEAAGASSKARFLSDPAVTRAGCVIETRHGPLVFDREKMLQKIEEAAC